MSESRQLTAIMFTDIVSHPIPSAWNTTVQSTFVFNGDTVELHVAADKRRLKWIKKNKASN